MTAGAPTTYDKVRALEARMAANTRYSLDAPSLRDGAHAVDQFLFEDHLGFCEQIGSSLLSFPTSTGGCPSPHPGPPRGARRRPRAGPAAERDGQGSTPPACPVAGPTPVWTRGAEADRAAVERIVEEAARLRCP